MLEIILAVQWGINEYSSPINFYSLYNTLFSIVLLQEMHAHTAQE